MRLHRNDPPAELGSIILIGDNEGQPVSMTTEPRTIIGAELDEFLTAFAKACAVIWGMDWRSRLEVAARLRSGTVRKWMQQGTIPPPVIVAWVAYIRSREDARAIGRFLEGLGETDTPSDTMREALAAARGMNG